MVKRGEVVGTMDDWSWRNQLIAAQAKYEAAMLTMQGDLARHCPGGRRPHPGRLSAR